VRVSSAFAPVASLRYTFRDPNSDPPGAAHEFSRRHLVAPALARDRRAGVVAPRGPNLNSTLARALYFAAQRWRGEPVDAVLADLERPRGLDERLAIQFAHARALARHAFDTVPFYRQAWSASGFSPEMLRDETDWARLPVLDKRVLQERGAELRSSRAPKGALSSTSGSSGTPVTVMRSHLSWAHHHANIFRGWHWLGLDVGDPYAYFWGRPMDAATARKAAMRDWLFNRERCSAFSLDAARARAFYERIRRRPMRFGYGYPSAVTHFAEEVAAAGLDGRALGWTAVVTTAEMLREHQRERLASVFGCAVADSYGCAETGVAGIECPQGGMHVPVESVMLERVPAENDTHEVLLTDLHNWSQPIIRYRVGDLVGEPPSGPCACGRTLPRVGRLEGRAGDFVTLPDGRRINGLIPYYIFRPHAKGGQVREYQFVEFPGGRIELRVLPGPNWEDAASARIEREVTEGLGVPIQLRVVEAIRRMGRGKHRDWVRAEDVGEA
jgi:phenylacetate-CoA ligase